MNKFNEPKIFIFNNNTVDKSIKDNFYIVKSDLGSTIKTKYSKTNSMYLFNINDTIIDNLHEYRVIIIDLSNTDNLEQDSNGTDFEKEFFVAHYPQTKVRTSPFIMQKIFETVNQNSLRIVFADSDYKERYSKVEYSSNSKVINDKGIDISIYNTFHTEVKNKVGYNFKLADHKIAKVVSKYFESYKVIFQYTSSPTEEWNSSYIPLLYNDKEEVISYIYHCQSTGYELILPQCKNKEELIYELFTNVFPEIIPNIFPESKDLIWLNDNFYKPVDFVKIEEQKARALEKYNNELLKIKEKEDKINEANKFLVDLLTETGHVLVKAVYKYLSWLGFVNIIDMDGVEDMLREDLQIDCGDKLYIIEVKGIGGTSTDSECAQIIKHRRTRERENRDKDIIPIYIVNHQRYIDPRLRKNPPFSDDQILYANDDNRGLLTTWQLYKHYKLINEGIFTKEEIRQTFDEHGLMTLLPSNLVKVGQIKHYYKKHNAGIFDICKNSISVGDTIWLNKNEIWKKGYITNLQINGNDVKNANSGEIGMNANIELAEGFDIYIKK